MFHFCHYLFDRWTEPSPRSYSWCHKSQAKEVRNDVIPVVMEITRNLSLGGHHLIFRVHLRIYRKVRQSSIVIIAIWQEWKSLSPVAFLSENILMNSLSDLSTVPCLCIAKCVALFLKIIFTLLGVLFYFSFLLAKLIAYVETDRRKEKKKDNTDREMTILQ